MVYRVHMGDRDRLFVTDSDNGGESVLYVSRVEDKNRIFIRDTDDDVEESVTRQELSQIVRVNGVDIRGVTVDEHGVLSDVKVYIPHDKSDILRMKCKMMLGLDIEVWHGAIKRIGPVFGVGNNEPVRLRLSSFASRCENNMLAATLRDRVITLVLDDKITLKKSTLMNVSRLNIMYDLTEVTRRDTLMNVWDTIVKLAEYNSKAQAYLRVIDSPERIELLKALLVCYYGVDCLLGGPQITKRSDIAEALEPYLRERFDRLDSAPLRVLGGHEPPLRNYAESVFRGMTCNKSLSFSQIDDSWYTLFSLIGMHTVLPLADLRCLGHYCTNFNASEKDKDIFVRFYNRANMWIFDNFLP